MKDGEKENKVKKDRVSHLVKLAAQTTSQVEAKEVDKIDLDIKVEWPKIPKRSFIVTRP